jgi:predicted alpha-1,2-mannosidase
MKNMYPMKTIPKTLLLVFALMISFGCSTCKKEVERPVDLVDPLIDTRAPRFDYFVSAKLPFGMVALSPDTRHGELWNSGYYYDDEYILNFSHVHNCQTAGIPVMPVTGICRGNEGLEANKSKFSHDDETARAGYHKVFLEDYGITAELTATCRIGMHRYTFPESEEAHVLFDLGATLGATEMSYAYARKVSNVELEGYSVNAPTFRRKKPFIVYFVARFDQEFDDFAGWSKNKDGQTTSFVKPEADIIEGEGSGVYVSYNNVKEGDEILLKVAISYVSTENARLNMNTELAHWDFDRVVDKASNAWNDYLSRVIVEGGTKEQRVKLYTDLLRTASKSIASDVNGAYIDWTGPHPVVRQLPVDDKGVPTRPFIEGDGLWGSQWNLNILWSLVYPEYGNWMAETFLDYYRNAGTMDRCSWGSNFTYVMVGDHTTPLLAALMSTGRATFDQELAYAASYKNAFPGGIRDRAGYEAGPTPSGGGIDWYIDLGYVPVEINERGSGVHRGGTAMTLEYAYQDWCLAQMANMLGKQDDALLFSQRAGNWKNVFDQEIGWSRPRHVTGEWMEDFYPIALSGSMFNSPGYIEGNSATYSFYVPHQIDQLIEAMGGKEAFINRLDSNFLKAMPSKFITPHGYHAAGWVDYENQPSCHMAHLFNFAGAPWKTQYWVRQVKEITYGGTDPYSGYYGDDDQGQMGALGVLMAIGLFDVQGCVGENPKLEITSPLFDRVLLKFPDRLNPHKFKYFEIVTKKNGDEDTYIQHVKLNDKDWNSFQFPIALFFEGGKLEIELGPEPNYNWGNEKE